MAFQTVRRILKMTAENPSQAAAGRKARFLVESQKVIPSIRIYDDTQLL